MSQEGGDGCGGCGGDVRTLERSFGSWFHVILLLLCGFMTLSAGLTLRALTPLPVPMLSLVCLHLSPLPTPAAVHPASLCSHLHLFLACHPIVTSQFLFTTLCLFCFLKAEPHFKNHLFRMFSVLCSSNKNLLCRQELEI